MGELKRCHFLPTTEIFLWLQDAPRAEHGKFADRSVLAKGSVHSLFVACFVDGEISESLTNLKSHEECMKPSGVQYYEMLGHSEARGKTLFVLDIPSCQQ